MRVRTDDEINAVNSEWLGPPGRRLFRARYVAWGIGFCLMVAALVLESWLGVDPSAKQGVFTLAGVVLATIGIGRCITPEYPARVLPVIFGHELTAPRSRDGSSWSASIRPRVKVRDRHRSPREWLRGEGS